MSATRALAAALLLAVLTFSGARADPATPAARVAKAPPPVAELPQGELLAKYRDRLRTGASTFWRGWPPVRAVDGEVATSWFSAEGDAAALGTRPWIEVIFPEDVTVQHVLAQGNREPPWQDGYSIVVARAELYEEKGALLASQGNETGTPTYDIAFHFKAPVGKVRRLRFVSLADQGDKNPYRDIAIGELRAW